MSGWLGAPNLLPTLLPIQAQPGATKALLLAAALVRFPVLCCAWCVLVVATGNPRLWPSRRLRLPLASARLAGLESCGPGKRCLDWRLSLDREHTRPKPGPQSRGSSPLQPVPPLSGKTARSPRPKSQGGNEP